MPIESKKHDKKRLLRLASSSSEQHTDEMIEVNGIQTGRERKTSGVVPYTKRRNRKSSRLESETIGYGESDQEEGEVMSERTPIRAEVGLETEKKKTRSGRSVKRPEWWVQNLMIRAVEKGNPEEEAEKVTKNILNIETV